jgi:hypothetical protein
MSNLRRKYTRTEEPMTSAQWVLYSSFDLRLRTVNIRNATIGFAQDETHVNSSRAHRTAKLSSKHEAGRV